MIKRAPGNFVLWAIVVLVLALGLYLALAVFDVQTLLYDTEVNEEFAAGPAEGPGPAAEPSPAMGPGSAVEPSPDGPVLVSSGEFHAVAHEGTGDAIVYREEDGSYVLRLENLDIFNGPDLYVYAVAAPDANDDDTVLNAGFVSAGQLKGNQGNQTYDLPAEFDPERHRSITVWCQPFSVNFATAPLR